MLDNGTLSRLYSEIVQMNGDLAPWERDSTVVASQLNGEQELLLGLIWRISVSFR